jgi:ribonuclease P protein component
MPSFTPNQALRLARYADYQRVYKAGRKQHARQISYFYALRPSSPSPSPDAPNVTAAPQPHATTAATTYTGPRIGLTVGKVLGKAPDRNRIKRRLRECLRRHASLLPYPVDVILHPRRTVLDTPAATLDREVALIFRSIAASLDRTQRDSSATPTIRQQAFGAINATSATTSHASVTPPAQPARS